MENKIIMVLLMATIVSCNARAKKTDLKTDTLPAAASGIKAPKHVCQLVSTDLQQRKETVLKSLVKQIQEKKDLANGIAFKFPGSDEMIDELVEFIKTERACCNFFIFSLTINGDKSHVWLQLTGDGVKSFIASELKM